MKSLFKCVLAVVFCAIVSDVYAACIWTSGDQVCAFYTEDCISTEWCLNEDCLGKNFGEEIMLVPGGAYPRIWIARTDGYFFSWGAYHCDVTSNPGVTILELPIFEDGHTGCVVGLETDEHSYREFFATNPETDCVGWVECQCE